MEFLRSPERAQIATWVSMVLLICLSRGCESRWLDLFLDFRIRGFCHICTIISPNTSAFSGEDELKQRKQRKQRKQTDSHT